MFCCGCNYALALFHEHAMLRTCCDVHGRPQGSVLPVTLTSHCDSHFERSSEIDILKGTGQGRILAPFINKVYISSLLKVLTDHCYASQSTD